MGWFLAFLLKIPSGFTVPIVVVDLVVLVLSFFLYQFSLRDPSFTTHEIIYAKGRRLSDEELVTVAKKF